MLNCAAIIVADAASRTAAADEALAALLRNGDSLVRVGNPLNAPLTLRRLLIQLELNGLDDGDDEDEDMRLVQLLERRAALGSVALVIEQAETLEPAALLPLQQLATGSGSVKIVFVGKPAFWTLLDGASLAPLRRALIQKTEPPAAIPTFVDGPAMPAKAVTSVGPLATRWVSASPRSGRRWWIGGATALFFTLMAVAMLAPGGLFNRATPRSEASGTLRIIAEPTVMAPSRPEPVVQEPAATESVAPMPAQDPTSAQREMQPAAPMRAQKLQARPSMPRAVSSAPSGTRVQSQRSPQRSEFEQFLAASGYDMAALSDEDRSALLGQFLAGKARGAAVSDAPSQPEAHVVILYTEGSISGETVNRLADEAAPLAASVQVRVVESAPGVAEIRFFRPEDGARARELADALHGSLRRVQVRDFAAYRPSPPLGTIEVWLPRG